MLCAAAISVLATLARAGDNPHDLVIQEIEGDLVCSIHARRASLSTLLSEIAERTGRKIEGLDACGALEPITVELDGRPLNQVVHTLLGCAGLRARIHPTAIEVLPDLGPRASAEDLDEQAGVAWLRALQNHPEHPLGAQAEIRLGEIQERRGHARTAAGHYDLVVRNWPESALAPEALVRCGAILEKNGQWSEAAVRFTTLANLVQPHTYATKARLELARCLAGSNDARQALFVLDALDNLFPDPPLRERQARLFVRALALGGLGRHGEALHTLQDADAIGVESEWQEEALELRAEALEHFDRPAEAARMWLKLSQSSQGKEKERALVNAARLAHEAGDAIGVLMIQRSAAGTAAAASIEAFAREARQELELDEAGTNSIDVQAALDRAQELATSHSWIQAREVLEPLYARRDQLDAPTLVLVAVAHARAMDGDGDGVRGLEAAIEVLRECALSLVDVENRKPLYVCAGELYEKHERYDEAIAAYGGSL